MSRLVDADHYVGNTLTNSFVEKDISYDKNTNLLTLKRYNNGTLTDDLSFSYLGNRRVGYNCDLNGNITNDATENLQVSYNFLNLPTAISQNSEVKARYSYAADSTKLGVVDASGVGYDYRGSFKYIRNGSSIELESVASAGGRTYKTDSGYEVRYFITDHLGSVRAVVNADGENVEQNDYMPYGTLHANSALQKTDNRYLYGGKELQTDFGVNYYDSFARFQRTDGAFNSIDPKAENYFHISPYAYCAGNPINTVDVDGRAIETVSDVISLCTGARSLAQNVCERNYKAAIVDAVGVAVDAIAVAFPGIPGGVGTIIKGIRFADKIDDAGDAIRTIDAGKDVWKMHPFERGNAIERALGGHCDNSPTIDKFEDGIAISIKSLDLNARSYQSGNAVISRVKGYIDKVAKYTDGKLGGTYIPSSEIQGRALELAIPTNATESQLKQLKYLEKYAADKNVQLTIIRVQ